MEKLIIKIDSILETLKLEPDEKAAYTNKIQKYNGECGCSAGAVFMTASLIISILYLSFSSHWGESFRLKTISMVLLFVFVSSITGKLFGIGVAKSKLLLVYRSLLKKQTIKN